MSELEERHVQILAEEEEGKHCSRNVREDVKGGSERINKRLFEGSQSVHGCCCCCWWCSVASSEKQASSSLFLEKQDFGCHKFSSGEEIFVFVKNVLKCLPAVFICTDGDNL